MKLVERILANILEILVYFTMKINMVFTHFVITTTDNMGLGRYSRILTLVSITIGDLFQGISYSKSYDDIRAKFSRCRAYDAPAL